MNSQPLISSQNPVSSQQPVPCMTIRLTPQIISQLNQSPPPRISFCIKDRTISIDDVKHTLQAFTEDPSLCEVYSLRSDRLVQVGNIEHKLIVQREVNAKNTPSSTAKLSESHSAHSNPLAPKSGSSQRAKRPRDAATPRQGVKRPVTSNSSTPRRPISHSPMDPRPSSPERQPAPTTSTKSTKINSSLPLRDQVMHLLAIQPMSAAVIARRLSQHTKNLATILKAIAQYEVPGKYHLRDDILANVHIDSWPYSEAEKLLVLKNIESATHVKISDSVFQEGSVDLTSLSIEDDCAHVDSEAPTPMPKPRSNRPSPQQHNVPGPPCEVGIRTQSDEPNCHKVAHSEILVSNIRSSANANSREVPPEQLQTSFPPFESHEEYLLCRTRFEEMYPRYSAIDCRLKEIAADFTSMAVKLDAPNCPSAERRKIQQQVKELYAHLKPEVDRLKLEFNTMHEEMARLKSRIRIYVDTMLL